MVGRLNVVDPLNPWGRWVAFSSDVCAEMYFKLYIKGNMH